MIALFRPPRRASTARFQPSLERLEARDCPALINRAPLITLIVIFSVSVVGLTLVPGVDDQGRPAHIGLFDSFYFVSYTATTIGWP